MPLSEHACRALIGLPLLAAPLAAVDLDTVQIHGFISQGYLQTTQTDWFGHTSDRGSFEFDEAAINASAQPVNGLRLGVQLLARDMAQSGNNRIEIDWAFADWRIADRSGVKVGRIKMPYGLYNESRDLDFDHPTVLLPQVIYLPQLRDYSLAINGAMVYGGLNLGRAGQLDASLLGGGQSLPTDGDLASYLRDLGAGQTYSDVKLDSIVNAAVTWQTPVDGLRFRISGIGFWSFASQGRTEAEAVVGQPGVFADVDIHTTVAGYYSGIVSAEYQREGLTLAAEWLREYAHRVADVTAHPYTFIPGPAPGSTIRVELPAALSTVETYTLTESMYGSVSYRIADRFELSASRQLRFADRDHPGRDFDRTWAFAARYDIFSNWLMKAEWQQHSGSALDTGGDHPDGWNLFALKTTVDF